MGMTVALTFQICINTISVRYFKPKLGTLLNDTCVLVLPLNFHYFSVNLHGPILPPYKQPTFHVGGTVQCWIYCLQRPNLIYVCVVGFDLPLNDLQPPPTCFNVNGEPNPNQMHSTHNKNSGRNLNRPKSCCRPPRVLQCK